VATVILRMSRTPLGTPAEQTGRVTREDGAVVSHSARRPVRASRSGEDCHLGPRRSVSKPNGVKRAKPDRGSSRRTEPAWNKQVRKPLDSKRTLRMSCHRLNPKIAKRAETAAAASETSETDAAALPAQRRRRAARAALARRTEATRRPAPRLARTLTRRDGAAGTSEPKAKPNRFSSGQASRRAS